MPQIKPYPEKRHARLARLQKWCQRRGALAFELFVVETTPIVVPEDLHKILPEHLAYKKETESAEKLFLAGPLSDFSGD